MTDAPERIFLQDAGDYARAAAFEVTWCVEPQDDADTEYIRADKVAALVEALQCLLRFAENTESELGIVLDSADLARAALAAFKGDTTHGD